MDEFIAKSNPPESIRQHTDRLLALLEELRRIYPECLTDEEYEIVKLACEYHDYGKTVYNFQKKISAKAGQAFSIEPEMEKLYQTCENVPHGYLSPAFIPIKELKQSIGMENLIVLVSAVFYHHTRPIANNDEIRNVIENDLQIRMGDRYTLTKGYLSKVMNGNVLQPEERWRQYAVVKGMLNRLDYAASAGSDTIEEARTQDGLTLGETVECRLTRRFSLRPVQEYMKAMHSKNLVVNASTGVGKTEAACLWAGGSKLFYTLPIKASINAIYWRLTGDKENEYGFKQCSLLHSDAINILLHEESGDDEAIAKFEKTRLFAYPVTICTADQLFTFVYRYAGCEIIPAVLKYSWVVIDEIQAYTPEIAAKLIIGMKLITKFGGKFAVITATMPPVLEDAMQQESIEFEKHEPFLLETPRHFLCYSESDFDYDVIVEQGKQSKVLVICNTVKRACQVYTELQERASNEIEGSTRLLHSRFKQKHRAMLEADIIAFSSGDGNGIWVTTQIVEASLDIDFDYLHTEMCAADSLLQRLGRCWRRRSYTMNEPNVFVYGNSTGIGTVYNKDIYRLSVEFLPKYCGKIFTEQEKIEYISRVYDTKALVGTDYVRELYEKLSTLEVVPMNAFTAADAKAKFRNIVSKSVIEDADYEQMADSGELDELGTMLLSRNKAQKIKAREKFLEHTIAVNPHYLKIKPDKIPIRYKGKPGVLPEVFRIPAKYEFDEETHIGRGLLTDDEPNEGTTMI